MTKFKHPLLIFIFIVLCSALFRITNMDYIEFKEDEATNLYLASRPIFGHSIPPVSTVSSMGIHNSPLINYILFPLTAISTNPKNLSFFIGLINSVSIGFFFLLVKKYYNLTTGLIASLLLAFSPWSILYSRKIWAQDLIFPFIVLLLFSIHKLIIDKDYKYWLIYVTISLFLIQLHQPSLFFVVLMSLLLLIERVKINVKYILIGLILGVIPLLPYINYQIVNNCLDCDALLAANSKKSENFDFILFLRPLQIMSQGYFNSILGEDMLTFSKKFPLAYQLRRFFYIEYILLPLGMIFFWRKYRKIRILVYITILLPIIYFIFRIVPHIHYFVILIPLLFLMLATVFSTLIESRNLLFRSTSAVIFTILIITSIIFNSAFINLVKQQKKLKGDYGQAYILTEKQLIKSLKKYKNSKNYEEMFISSFVPEEYLQ